MYIYKHTRSSIITLIGRSINWWGSFINSFDLDVAKFMLSTVYCTVPCCTQDERTYACTAPLVMFRPLNSVRACTYVRAWG